MSWDAVEWFSRSVPWLEHRVLGDYVTVIGEDAELKLLMFSSVITLPSIITNILFRVGSIPTGGTMLSTLPFFFGLLVVTRGCIFTIYCEL